MLKFSLQVVESIKSGTQEIHSFIEKKENENIDWETVNSFGEEWKKFNSFSDREIQEAGDQYFDIVDETILHKNAYVLDVGCGTGRWTKYVSDKVCFVEAIDPSNAVFQAATLLKDKHNVRISQASVDGIPFDNNSFDLVFSLGVLHHIPDTFAAIKKCVEKIKPGGYFFVYLYYNLDNRGFFYKALFVLSDLLRRGISRLPHTVKKITCDILAIFFYMPWILFSRLLDKFFLGRKIVRYIPLSYYRNKTFNIIRNDSLDRFGTPLEQRFSREQIESMLKNAGLTEIKFSNNEPFWHAIGKKPL